MTRLIRLPEVRRLTSLSKTEIARRMREGEFPPNHKLGSRTVVWREDEVAAWIDRATAPPKKSPRDRAGDLLS
ncbi:AlpA family phage regulatory protein [Hyphomonas polymorpha]|uniref:helix-turn-helix transcriptional regulator n=1 Tax=Hyphomonas polymorpha TaxID=74319 RepID=UPI000A042946